MPVEAWRKAESHYPAHKLEFLALKWAVVKKFHEYLYGLTFNVHMDNNLLTYMLTTAKLDAASHHWATSLANYNFQLQYRACKANIDADALSRVSWPWYMSDSSSTHLKVTTAAIQAVQEAALQRPASSIEAYSSDLYIMDILQDSKQIASMTLEDWHQAQEVDPVLSLVITRLRDGMLGKGQSKATDPPEVSQFGWEWNHLVLKKDVLYRQDRPRELEENLLQLVLPAAHREVALRGCPDEVGHLGLEHMLDLMCDRFFWPCMAAQAKKHVRNCHLSLTFKARQPKAPLKNIMATHPLELVHLDYLCLEPGKGLEENIPVVTDHFTGMPRHMSPVRRLLKWLLKPYGTSSLSTLGYPKRSSWIMDETLKVSWWLTSVSWWGHGKCGPAHTICKPMASVKDSIPPWLICLGPYPRKRNQSGRITLECWFMCTTAPEIQLQGSAPTFSCLGDNLISSSTSCLVWLHAQSWNQTHPSLYRKSGSTPGGLRKRLRHFRPKKGNDISATMISEVGQQPWKLGTWF